MHHLLLPLALGLSLSLVGCEKKQEFVTPKTDTESAQQVDKNRSMATEQQLKLMRDEFAAKLQQELNEMNTRLNELKAKALTLSGQAREKIDREVQSLEQEQKVAAQKIEELKAATSEKWDELKVGAADTMERLQRAYQKAKEEF